MNGMRGGARAWARRAVTAVAIVAASSTSGDGRATEPLSIARLYGAGVHAYFSGDYLQSYDDLTATIEAGSRDPRTHYFRGLAALGLGRLDEAEADFSTGAGLEAEEAGDWPVSRSLERVQGHPRFQLERHRARARVAALQRARDRNIARYREIQAAQPDVQRDRRPTGRPAGTDEATNPFAGAADAGSNPVDRSAAPEEMPTPAEAEPTPEIPGDDPFGDASQPELEMPAEPAGVDAEAGEPGPVE